MKEEFNLLKEYLERTIKAWQPYSSTQLTEEDAREIVENMKELFSFLDELEKKYGNKQKSTKQDHLKKRGTNE